MPLPILAYPTLEHAGRLGNQLWQIASTVGLARKYNHRPLFPHEWSYRSFFSCPDEWFGVIPKGAKHSYRFATSIHPRSRAYLQDYGLWRDSIDEVRKAFRPSELAADVIDTEWEKVTSGFRGPVTAVHVRRGDYVTNPTGTLTSLPYAWYATCQEMTFDNDVIYFSDDIEWCRSKFAGACEREHFYEGVSRPAEHEGDYMSAPVLDWIDLFLMQRCQKFVISNSTYSWWGAWLAKSSEVRYPSRWYGADLVEFCDARKMFPRQFGWTEVKVHD